jgi:hypothetical protein
MDGPDTFEKWYDWEKEQGYIAIMPYVGYVALSDASVEVSAMLPKNLQMNMKGVESTPEFR